MNTLLVGYGMILGIGLMSAVGDIGLERWARHQSNGWLAAGLLLWLVSLVLFGLFLRHQTISFTAAVLLVVVSHLLFDMLYDSIMNQPHLHTLQWLGVALTVLGVILVEWNRAAAPITGATP